MKIIFLDFDGVLFDSVKEAYLLARKAYFDVDVKAPIDSKHYQKFRNFRYLVTHSWQFYYILKLIEENAEGNVFENLFTQNTSKTQAVIDFDNKYTEARENLLKSDFDFWDKLDEPFEFFYDIKKLSEDDHEKFIILTNKKRLPVQNKLKKYDVNNIKLFANEDLKAYNNKAEFIDKYIQNYNIDTCFLIEDSIDNINFCKKYSNIRPLLVSWGYIHPSEKGLERSEILEIIKE
ncbi:hypothetical protein KID03_09215 [bacterium]|nr:hypothetical protein [bacterium]